MYTDSVVAAEFPCL